MTLLGLTQNAALMVWSQAPSSSPGWRGILVLLQFWSLKTPGIILVGLFAMFPPLKKSLFVRQGSL